MRRFRRGSRPTRKMDWEFARGTFAVVGTASIATPGTLSGSWVLPPTVVRDFYTSPTLYATRSFVTITTTAGTTTITGVGALGIIRWNDKDDTVPAAGELPDPLDNADLDWIGRWVAPFVVGMPALSQGNPNVFEHTHLIKARRKLENTSGILAVFSAAGLGAGVTVQATFDMRFLLRQV